MTVSGAEVYNVSYGNDLNNRLLTTTKTAGTTTETTTYLYDRNGNTLSSLVEKTAPASGGGSVILGGNGYEINRYNGLNQLISTTKDGTETTYVYKPDGLRQSKTTGGVKTTHIWDGQNIAAELTGTAITAKYLRGVNLIWAQNAAGVKTYFSFNAHGDVVQLVNANGTVTKNYSYDAFGVEKDPDSADANPWRYCGEYFDTETGSVYLRARNYNPATGRFLTEDTFRGTPNDPLSLNLYAYCGNNPIFFVDPSGHQRAPGYYDIDGTLRWYNDVDAAEFGIGSDTYKIIDDASKRWFDTNDQDERNRLHGLANDARAMARAGASYMYGQDKVMNMLRVNIGVMIDQMLFYKNYMMTAAAVGNYGAIADPYVWFVNMTFTDWDYKWDPAWQVPAHYGDAFYMMANGEIDYYMHRRNYTPWIYFEGRLWGADKIGNINLGYIGTMMGFGGVLIKNFDTMDKDDGPAVELGIRLAGMRR